MLSFKVFSPLSAVLQRSAVKNYLEGSGIIKEFDHQGSVFLYSEDSGWAARFSRIANPLLFLTRIRRSRMPVEAPLSCAEGREIADRGFGDDKKG